MNPTNLESFCPAVSMPRYRHFLTVDIFVSIQFQPWLIILSTSPCCEYWNARYAVCWCQTRCRRVATLKVWGTLGPRKFFMKMSFRWAASWHWPVGEQGCVDSEQRVCTWLAGLEYSQFQSDTPMIPEVKNIQICLLFDKRFKYIFQTISTSTITMYKLMLTTCISLVIFSACLCSGKREKVRKLNLYKTPWDTLVRHISLTSVLCLYFCLSVC